MDNGLCCVAHRRRVRSRAAVLAVDAILNQAVHRTASEDPARLARPVLDLFVQGAARSLALASLQGRLLGEVQLCGSAWLTPMSCAVLGMELGIAMLDEHAASREMPDQLVGDADDLPDWPFPGNATRSLREVDSESTHHPVLEPGVVSLRSSDPERVEPTSIQRTPLAVGTADLVGHRNVCMQVWVAAPRLTMVESNSQKTGGVDLCNAPVACPREG